MSPFSTATFASIAMCVSSVRELLFLVRIMSSLFHCKQIDDYNLSPATVFTRSLLPGGESVCPCWKSISRVKIQEHQAPVSLYPESADDGRDIVENI